MRLVRSAGLTGVATLASRVLGLTCDHAMMRHALPTGHFAAQAPRLAVAIGSGLAALAASARLLRIREFDDVAAVVRARFARRRSGLSSGTKVARPDGS